LEPRDPPVRAWSRLERAIRLEHTPRLPADDAPSRTRRALLLWLAAAAALVLATFVGLRFRPDAIRSAAPVATSTAPSRPGAADAAGAAQAVETELRAAEDHYEKAIKGLEQIAKAEQGVFDPRT